MKTVGQSLIVFASFCLAFSFACAAPGGKLKPVHLQCELRYEPLGIDVPHPDLGYTLEAVNSTGRGLRQTAYEIQVASSPLLLQNNKGDLWSPGKRLSDKMAYIKYEGRPLHSNQQCWWRVRVWDNDGHVSGWSAPATWVMGIIKTEDWTAKWISADGAEKFALPILGYRAGATKTPAPKWVQVDLGKPVAVSQVRITPAFFEDRAGWGFPANFTIEIAGNEHFDGAAMLADYRYTDFPNPGWKPAGFPAANAIGRYIRITAHTPAGRESNPAFALRRLEVFSGGKNIAAGKTVTASDSNDTDGWNKKNLTDGPEDASALRNYSSMVLRKEFSIGKKLLRAVVNISGLSNYELTINGLKVGDYLLAPGWTDYRKTVLYDTYDVTAKLQAGTNAIGIMLGNGMYNIQPDSIRYVKFLNTFGQLKAIAQLQLEYADGSKKTIGTDASWQEAPGPVTYSNLYGGEDYDANIEEAGWNKPFFKGEPLWRAALETTGPGGQLKGLSCAAPPVKVIQVIKPVHATQINPHIWIYDCGQNASMMPRITVTGPKGSYVRIIPSELLGKDGYADRTSATQNGVRPAWWQYTLSGKGMESWQPKFFYQGARYLQVELFPATQNGPLPEVNVLEDQIVHSSSKPAGTFASSNKLFERIYGLVRWAQRSNMMSFMTDCPQREKMGWLEQNHLNGPALRYNFDMALLFRKTMSDMADAQLDNGFVPNIAPEYFIAGQADLSNAMRNSPEWGSSFIIVPWQQYLFSGDISMLKRYYDKMKRYVGFLSSTANDNIIHTGLGDWYDIGPKEPWGSQLTPVALTGTAVFYYDNWIMSQIAGLLHREEDAASFKNKAGEIRVAFNREFYQEATGQYSTGSQTANAMPLFLGLVEPQNREKVLTAIVADIRGRGNGLTSGDVGYRFLLSALANAGRSDVIFDMNNQSEKPGYGYQLKMGATSLTEKWDAGAGNFGSQNHFMLGQINEWFFNDLVGISSDETAVGFRKIIIKPAVTGDLTWVKGSFTSISGKILSEWEKKDKRIEMTISIPPNTSAVVYIPSANETGITESGKSVSAGKYIKYIKNSNGYSVFEVGSGNYRFSAALK